MNKKEIYEELYKITETLEKLKGEEVLVSVYYRGQLTIQGYPISDYDGFEEELKTFTIDKYKSRFIKLEKELKELFLNKTP